MTDTIDPRIQSELISKELVKNAEAATIQSIIENDEEQSVTVEFSVAQTKQFVKVIEIPRNSGLSESNKLLGLLKFAGTTDPNDLEGKNVPIEWAGNKPRVDWGVVMQSIKSDEEGSKAEKLKKQVELVDKLAIFSSIFLLVLAPITLANQGMSFVLVPSIAMMGVVIFGGTGHTIGALKENQEQSRNSRT